MSHTRSAALFLRLLILASFFASVHSTCYLPNGTSPDDNFVQPCSTDPSNALSSVCCHTKWDNPPGSDLKYGQIKDECMPNGLCQNRGKSSIPGQEFPPWKHFYRVMCTDKDFKGCLDVCGTGLNAHDTVQLTPCDGTATSEKWCCGDNTDCCSAGFEYKALYIPQELSSKSSSQTTLYSAQTRNQSMTSNSTSTSTPSPAEPDKGLAGGAKAGIAIGAILGFLLSITLGFFIGHLAKPRWNLLGKSKDGAAELGADQYGATGVQHEHKAGVYTSHEMNHSTAHEIGEAPRGVVYELADQGGKKHGYEI